MLHAVSPVTVMLPLYIRIENDFVLSTNMAMI